jgi:glutamine amidotransferase
MCRIAAYLGTPLPLQRFLLDPPHSLLKQSWQPRELIYTTINADGHGFGWYGPDGLPAVYTSTMPIWSDYNLPHLARTLSSPLWLAEIRSATDANPVHQCNTQPFHDTELLYAHNGFIQNFRMQLRHRIERMLTPVIGASIKGNTDSEYLFALLRQVLFDNPDVTIEEALSLHFARIGEWAGDQPALLNVVVTEGRRLYAARHGLNHACPSLYYTTDDDAFPGGQLIASERLTASEFWQPVPEHHILILDPDEPPELIAL